MCSDRRAPSPPVFFLDELFNRETFYTLDETRVLIEPWCCEYNHLRPHGSLGYRPLAPKAVEWPVGSRVVAVGSETTADRRPS